MGYSLSVDIGYGVDAGYTEERYDTPLPWDEDGEQDFEDWLVESLTSEKDPYSDGEFPDGYPNRNYSLDNKQRDDDYARQMAEWEVKNKDWLDRRDAWLKAKKNLISSCPIDVTTYGYHEYPGILILVRGTYQSHYDAVLKVENLEVNQETLARAHKFCEEHNIPFETPGWIAAASYG